MKTLKRGLIEFNKVGGPFAGIALGCVLIVPAMIFASVGLALWMGLLVDFALVMLMLILYGLRKDEDVPKCRACGQMKPLAITYESDGVCRECLDEVLRVQGLE